MKVKNMQIRCKKMDFINDCRNIKFKMKPVINFQVGKLAENIYNALCDVRIEATEDNDMPIRANYLVEAIFEFEGNVTNEEANTYLAKNGVETVYSYTRSIVASTTAIAGVPAINLPIINFEEKHNDVNAN